MNEGFGDINSDMHLHWVVGTQVQPASPTLYKAALIFTKVPIVRYSLKVEWQGLEGVSLLELFLECIQLGSSPCTLLGTMQRAWGFT